MMKCSFPHPPFTRKTTTILVGTITALLAIHAAAPCTRAATVVWDIAPGTVGVGDFAITGGSGLWDSSIGNWTADAGANNIAWNNAGNDTAVFGGSAGNVTVGIGITVGGLIFNDAAGYLVSGNTVTFAAPGTITANVSAAVSSVIGGTAGAAIAVAGTATLTLSGANTFQGQLTVWDATLAIGTINNSSTVGVLGNSANAVVLGDAGGRVGTLEYTGGTASSTKTFTLANGGMGVFQVESAGTTLTLSGIIGGSGNLTKTGAGILALSGNNTFTGVTTISAGTLSVANIGNGGVARNLGQASSSATNLVFDGGTLRLTGSATTNRNFTINPSKTAIIEVLSGLTLIMNGASAASDGSLLKDGLGVLTLQGSNLYTGTTTINAGTLTLSGAAGSIAASTAIVLNGGNLTLTNTTTSEGGVNRLANSAGITSNGGTLTYNNSSGANTYAETLGSINMNTGHLNVIAPNAVTSGGTETLTLGTGSLTHAPTNPSSIAFAGSGLGANNLNRILVTGQNTTPVSQIIGPWATCGITAGLQTDYAAYNITAGATNAFGIQSANIAASPETTWTTATNAYTMSGNQTLTATRTIMALRDAGIATLSLGSNNLETFGILNGGTERMYISSTGGVVRQPGAASASLFISTGNNDIVISAPIQDHTGALTLVKSGTDSSSRVNSDGLVLSGANTFSGGVALNTGRLVMGSPTALGTGSLTIY